MKYKKTTSLHRLNTHLHTQWPSSDLNEIVLLSVSQFVRSVMNKTPAHTATWKHSLNKALTSYFYAVEALLKS